MRRHITTLGAAAFLVMSLAPQAAAVPSVCNGLDPTITADGLGEVIVGTAGDDVIMGTSGADTIRGFGGNDTICGLGGPDILYGGPGDDWIMGGPGADRIYGTGGSDIIDGGPGNDRLAGGPGDDVLTAGDGNDTLRGGYDADFLDGGDGEDRLFGGTEADWLDGGDADDYLHGGKAGDTLLGGMGDDEMWGRGGADVMHGGDDIDLLRAGYGIDECTGEQLGGCEVAEVSPGDQGLHVTYLQSRLADALLYRGPENGSYPVDALDQPGRMTAAVFAFHKLHQDPLGDQWTAEDNVSAEWTLADWALLNAFVPEVPRERTGELNRLEVDAHHEVMWMVLDGELAGIFHVSIGGEYRYMYNGEWRIAHTPRGDFDIDRYAVGTTTPGYQYKSWYFEQNYYAVHGFWKVPPYPASHGCVRVLFEDADWLTARLKVSWPIHIWDE